MEGIRGPGVQTFRGTNAVDDLAVLAMGILITGPLLVLAILLVIGALWLGGIAVLGAFTWVALRRGRRRNPDTVPAASPQTDQRT